MSLFFILIWGIWGFHYDTLELQTNSQDNISLFTTNHFYPVFIFTVTIEDESSLEDDRPAMTA